MDGYHEVRVVQRGSYGVVSLVEDRRGRRFAVKRISQDSPDLVAATKMEITVHEQLHHQNVVEMVDHFEEPSNERNDGPPDQCLVLEWCSQGDLHECIRRGELTGDRERLRSFVLQLIDVVEWCHSQGVYHRDIKPENVMLSAHDLVKLGDWGLASLSQKCKDFGVGSEQYMAPECFDKSAGVYDAAQADIWAVGIVLLNALFGRNPFKKASPEDRLFADYASCREVLYDIFPSLSGDVFAVLRHCLTIDPANRSLSAMRTALLAINTWTTDDEIEHIMTPPTTYSDAALPILSHRKPFRVPSSVTQRTAHTQRMAPISSNGWDRHNQFTPPAWRAPFMTSRRSRLRSRSSHTLEPPALIEEDETSISSDEAYDGDTVFAIDDLQNALPPSGSLASTSWADDDDDMPLPSKPAQPTLLF